jgi:hypothetical protein
MMRRTVSRSNRYAGGILTHHPVGNLCGRGAGTLRQRRWKSCSGLSPTCWSPICRCRVKMVYSLITKMRELDAARGHQTPAVALTAYVRVEDRARSLAAGFNLFVPKPVESSELIMAIANLADAGGGQTYDDLTPLFLLSPVF